MSNEQKTFKEMLEDAKSAREYLGGANGEIAYKSIVAVANQTFASEVGKMLSTAAEGPAPEGVQEMLDDHGSGFVEYKIRIAPNAVPKVTVLSASLMNPTEKAAKTDGEPRKKSGEYALNEDEKSLVLEMHGERGESFRQSDAMKAVCVGRGLPESEADHFPSSVWYFLKAQGLTKSRNA